jgi:hypothetical protein
MWAIPKGFDPERHSAKLIDSGVAALEATRRKIHALLERGGLRHQQDQGPAGDWKELLNLDLAAEEVCGEILETELGGPTEIRVLGEETLCHFPDLDLRRERLHGWGDKAQVVLEPETRLTAIVDMVDGSDLIERDLGNWCSALIFFKPGPPARILLSMIKNANGKIYGADSYGPFRIFPERKDHEEEFRFYEGLEGLEVRSLESPDKTDKRKIVPRTETDQIAICFYGQKVGHFTTIPPRLFEWMKGHPVRHRFRVYNFGGNPMMARLANGEGIHAVFEHQGQFPHDAAPGAYIGLKAGASLVDDQGLEITEHDLATYLLQPSGARLRYVLASSPNLASELAVTLGDRRGVVNVRYICSNNECQGTTSPDRRSISPCPHCGMQMQEDRRGRAAKA